MLVVHLCSIKENVNRAKTDFPKFFGKITDLLGFHFWIYRVRLIQVNQFR